MKKRLITIICFFENFSAQNSVLINLRELDKKTGDNFLIHPRRLQRV